MSYNDELNENNAELLNVLAMAKSLPSGGADTPSGGAGILRLTYGSEIDPESVCEAFNAGMSVWLYGTHTFEHIDASIGGGITPVTAEFFIPLLRAEYNEMTEMYEIRFIGADTYGNGIEAVYHIGWSLYIENAMTDAEKTVLVDAVIAALPVYDGEVVAV